MKSVQIRSFFWSVFSRIRTEYGEIRRISPNVGKYGPEKTPYLDTFHAVISVDNLKSWVLKSLKNTLLRDLLIFQSEICLTSTYPDQQKAFKNSGQIWA